MLFNQTAERPCMCVPWCCDLLSRTDRAAAAKPAKGIDENANSWRVSGLHGVQKINYHIEGRSQYTQTQNKAKQRERERKGAEKVFAALMIGFHFIRVTRVTHFMPAWSSFHAHIRWFSIDPFLPHTHQYYNASWERCQKRKRIP